MESLIPVMNKLQNIFKKTGTQTDAVQLPQIVVVGSQSCGKSSVLESLVGKSFLPRGTGIVTRCPIILELIHVDEIGEMKEWCSFPYAEELDKKYDNFDEVREAIQQLTDETAGSNQGISMDPITVRVCSPNVISLTVVDLPGVVKNAVGDQPDDIEDQVLHLIKRYVNNPNAIILAVSSADVDIATSESIKIAKQVDPTGDRTLAVITKLDRMDEGTDATKVLSGEVIQVKLGIIGVVNRSQNDINNNKSIENALEDENIFLRENYPNHIGEIGSPYLAKRLNQLLMKHIQDSLPELIKRIGTLTEHNEAKRNQVGPKIAEGAAEKLWVMLEIVNDFILAYKAAIKERTPESSDIDKEIIFPVKITDAYETLNYNLKRLDMYLIKLDKKISSEIRDSVNIERFTSIEDVFKKLAKQQIMLMQKPATDCAEAVHDILGSAIGHCLKDKRLESLNSVISRVTRKLLSSQLKEVKLSIQEYMKIQTGMIFSSDEEFLKLLKVSEPTEDVDEDIDFGLEALPSTRQKFSASFPMGTSINSITRNDDQCKYVKTLITEYFHVMRRQIADYMPKHLMYHLFDCTMDKLKIEIREAVAGKEMELVSEPERVIRQRQETEEMLQNLYQATEIISGIQSKQ